jgi:TRAP-type uncharacterized transport system substrate-binding protein
MSILSIKLTGSLIGAALCFAAPAGAKNITLSHTSGSAGGASDIAGKHLAEIAAANGIATIQAQVGKTLTKTMLDVAQGKVDISASPFVLNFLMSRGLGPYSGLGKKKGKEMAGNLRLLYPYHIASFYLIAFQSTGIDSWEKLKGKTIFNGPPRGGALISARNLIRLTTGFVDGKQYTGKQIAWGQANSLFLDRSVEAAVRPGTNPASYMPIYIAAGKINIVSVPKAKFEGPAFAKYLKAPGNAPVVFPVSEMDHYGDGARVISEDNTFRTVANTAGDMVHKKMSNKLAKSLTAAFIKSIPNLRKKVPFAKSALYGSIDNEKMRMCNAGVTFHPGALQAWEEAGHKVADCARPKS